MSTGTLESRAIETVAVPTDTSLTMNYYIKIPLEFDTFSRVYLGFNHALLLTAFTFSLITPPSTLAASGAIPEYCTEASHPIVITVHGVRNDHGSIKAKLYGDNPDNFLASGKKLDSKLESAQVTSTVICVQAPHPGTYAVVVHHDENGNKKLDRNWIGLPKEGVGFSNNPELFLAAPDHGDVTFQVQDGVTTVDIELRY